LLKSKILQSAPNNIRPAPGSEDTELGVLIEPEVGHGEAEVGTQPDAKVSRDGISPAVVENAVALGRVDLSTPESMLEDLRSPDQESFSALVSVIKHMIGALTSPKSEIVLTAIEDCCSQVESHARSGCFGPRFSGASSIFLSTTIRFIRLLPAVPDRAPKRFPGRAVPSTLIEAPERRPRAAIQRQSASTSACKRGGFEPI
jgi:hypothetical protein